MPNAREKLVELLKRTDREVYEALKDREDYREEMLWDYFASNLIANGVTVQEWIPVTERLPEDVYGKDREKIVVLVHTKIGNVSQCTRVADYACSTDATLSQVKWTKNGEFYWSKGKRVTHWMPLPQPPKGE